MAIQDLLKLLKQAFNKKKVKYVTNLRTSEIGDRRLGLDVSVAMHILVSKQHVAIAMYQEPHVCIQEFVDDYFNSILEAFKDGNTEVILVFDGRSHCHKEHTNQVRADTRAKLLADIDSFYATKNPINIQLIAKKD